MNGRTYPTFSNLRSYAVRLLPAAALLLASCASPSSLSSKARQSDQGQIESRLQEICEAVRQKDLDRLDGYHYYGPKFSKFEASSAARLDADASRKSEHEGIIRARDLTVRLDDIKIDLFGRTAVVTCIMQAEFRAGADIIQRASRATFVFVKDHREWLITHEHISPIAL